MIKCKTVRIKFVEKGLPQEEVAVQQVTGAEHIEVSQQDGFLRLECKAKQGGIVKQLNYRMQDVREYVITDTVWEQPVKSAQLELPFVSMTSNQSCSAFGCPNGRLCQTHAGRI